jgi:hypothetical protein
MDWGSIGARTSAPPHRRRSGRAPPTACPHLPLGLLDLARLPHLLNRPVRQGPLFVGNAPPGPALDRAVRADLSARTSRLSSISVLPSMDWGGASSTLTTPLWHRLAHIRDCRLDHFILFRIAAFEIQVEQHGHGHGWPPCTRVGDCGDRRTSSPTGWRRDHVQGPTLPMCAPVENTRPSV